MKTEIKMKWQPFHHYTAKQGFVKKGIVRSRGKEKGDLKKKVWTEDDRYSFAAKVDKLMILTV